MPLYANPVSCTNFLTPLRFPVSHRSLRHTSLMTPAFPYHDQLQSERLPTRFLTRHDIAAWTAFFNDADAIQYFPALTQPSNVAKATWWIERQLTRYRENRPGLQALVHRHTRASIGQCGLLLQEVDGTLEVEVGYDIFRKYWGQGYAPEAARLFIDYAFQHHLSDSIIAIIHTHNTKAQRVAEKIGLQREKQTCWADVDVYIYRIEKKAASR
jgi:[ribosomal protein S5]-alanine N-acetyltransferase